MIAGGLGACLVACLVVGPSLPGDLENGSFEEGFAPGGLPVGWSSLPGATHDTGGPPSSVELDRDRASDGSTSLRLAGTARTSLWHYLFQDLPAAGGERIVVRADLRTAGVQREGGQYLNPPLLLDFLGADGARLGRIWTATPPRDHDWGEVVLEGLAPAGTARVRVGLFLSMSGTLWVDDVRLERHPALPFDATARRAAAEAVERRLRATYPFFGLAGKPEADELFARFGARLRGDDPGDAGPGDDLAAFTDALLELLAELEDTHVSLETPEGRRWTHASRVNGNWNHRVVDGRLTDRVAAGSGWLVGRLGPEVGYVRIETFALGEDDALALDRAMDELSTCEALLLDVRSNGGGDENRARWIAGRFAAEPVVYARHTLRDPFASADTSVFLPPAERILQPRAGRAPDRRPVVVLQGPGCVSSTESFLLMMRALPGVTTVGLASRGASANPQPFEVVPGLTMHASTWRNLTPGGVCIEGVGVAPDVEVEAPAAVYAGKDPTLEQGRERALEAVAGD